MKGIESGDGRIDPSELCRVLAELEADELGLQDRADLMALIDRSPAAQRIYLEYFEMTAMLEVEARIHAEQGKMPVVTGQGGMAKRIFRRSVLAAAAIIMLSAIAATLFVVDRSEAGDLSVSATAGAQWLVDGVLRDPSDGESLVAKGSSIMVRSGMVELKLATGVTYVVQGPAHVSFSEPERAVLHDGWLWVDSASSDESLEVETPELIVRDIGTRFGVRVRSEGPAEVHLIEGKVEVLARSTGELLASLEPENRAFTIAPTGELKVLSLERDPFSEFSVLSEGPVNFATTVRSQKPAGYWRLDESKTGYFVNRVPEGVVGRGQPRELIDEPGPTPQDGFHGFEDENRSALAGLSLGTAPVHDGVLFQDDFTRGGGALDGMLPDVTMGSVKWAASSAFNGDGSINSGKGSAILPLVPIDGVIYTLDARVTASSGPNESWIGMGFGRSQSATLFRIGSGGMSGCAWILHRAADTTKPVNRAWLGPTVQDWYWPSGSPLGGTMDMRIILDTTAGPGCWTATWFAKRPDENDYRKVRDTEGLINESVSCVVLSVLGPGLSAEVESVSLRADRQPDLRPEGYLADGPARLSRKEGSVSCWVRREPGTGRPEMLWAAGERRLDGAVHAHLTVDGRAGFFMENGRYDVLIASEFPVDDGEWHHFVATWDSDSVNLYIDGRRVAQDTEFRGEQRGLLPELEFGVTDAISKFESFSGAFDEVAIWDRSLTFAEVVHQFRSARGE